MTGWVRVISTGDVIFTVLLRSEMKFLWWSIKILLSLIRLKKNSSFFGQGLSIYSVALGRRGWGGGREREREKKGYK